MIKKYKAKISYGLLATIFLLFFVPIIFSVVNNGIDRAFYVQTGILMPTYIIILHMFLKTEYTIENSTLKIKCGFLFNKEIDINKIKKISKTSSLMASPAPSFDRIEITYGTFDEILISPRNKVAFAKDLTMINAAIENTITVNKP